MGRRDSMTPSRVRLLFPEAMESKFVQFILPLQVSALKAVAAIFLLVLAGIDLICFSDITPTPGGVLLFFLGLFLVFKKNLREKQIYFIHILVFVSTGAAGFSLITGEVTTWGVFFFFLFLVPIGFLFIRVSYLVAGAAGFVLILMYITGLNLKLSPLPETVLFQVGILFAMLAAGAAAGYKIEYSFRMAFLYQSDLKYKDLVNSLPYGVFVVQNGEIVLFNPGLERLTGLTGTQLSGACPDRLFPRSYPGENPRDESVSDFIIGPDRQLIYIDKQSVEIVYNGLPAALFAVRDTTEQIKSRQEKKRLKIALEKAKKMEACGLLAGGVAHDLNNILSGLVSTPELLLMDLPTDSPLIKPVQIMKDSGKRAAIIVDELLTLARGTANVLEPVRLNDVIEDYLASPEFDRLAGFHPGVTLIRHLDPALPLLNASGLHMRKIVMNLTSNAMEAIQMGATQKKGEVTLETARVEFAQKNIKGYERTKDGPYVRFSVQDTGPGILTQDLDQIFEPFYTKKVLGRSGTGLGLSIVWNIVHDHNGYIRVTSEKGKTLFQIFFPVTDVLPEAPEPDRIYTLSDYSGNNETILVVDDVASQRKITSNMLKRLGYQATVVSSGEEAIVFIRNNKVDLVVLDMIMDPGISGLATFKEMKILDPDIRAVIASGYSKTNDVEKAQKLGAGPFIKKPYSLERLGFAIKEELHKRKS